MDCDPDELAELSKCFCFSEAQIQALKTYLLCQWVNS